MYWYKNYINEELERKEVRCWLFYHDVLNTAVIWRSSDTDSVPQSYLQLE